jgi:hypothetical protein
MVFYIFDEEIVDDLLFLFVGGHATLLKVEYKYYRPIIYIQMIKV